MKRPKISSGDTVTIVDFNNEKIMLRPHQKRDTTRGSETGVLQSYLLLAMAVIICLITSSLMCRCNKLHIVIPGTVFMSNTYNYLRVKLYSEAFRKLMEGESVGKNTINLTRNRNRILFIIFQFCASDFYITDWTKCGRSTTNKKKRNNV